MNHADVQETAALNFQGRLSFPESVKRLAEAGVRSYTADLVSHETRYYGGAVDRCGFNWSLEDMPGVAGEFSEAKVIEALRTVQRGEIDYPEFLRWVMRAGTSSYSVFLYGRKAIYFGRDGQFYLENFPSQQ